MKLVTLLATAVLAAAPARAVERAAADCADCAALLQHSLPGASVLRVSPVAAAAAMADAAPLPAHCLLQGETTPRTGVDGVRYSIGFELRLPLVWNGRFQFQGGGGVDGVIRPAHGTLRRGVTPALAQGTAVVSSNMGHTGADPRDARFGLDPQARIDWGYNAVDQVTQLAKALISRFYGQAPKYSYFVGNSGGGRQGMVAAQRYPQHFDGIVSGAPILEQHLAQIGSMQLLQAFTAIAPPNAAGQPILAQAYSDADLALITAGVLRRCDALDGVADGLIENYPACRYDVAELQCPGAKDASCLSPAQVTAFNAVMAGPRNSAGTLLYPPQPWDTSIAEPDWRADHLGTATGPVPNARKFSNQSIRLVFMTPPAPDFDYLQFKLDTDPARMLASAAITASNGTDITGFKARGGKHIVFVGLGDTLVNPAGVNRWYQQLVAANGGLAATQQHVRFFNVPGMGHSGGGAAMDIFDPVSALYDWVEKGQPPAQLLATSSRFKGRTRAICAWPQIARYTGSGSVDSAESFRCTAP